MSVPPSHDSAICIPVVALSGIMTLQDLADYAPITRDTINITLTEPDICVTAPPPSSGVISNLILDLLHSKFQQVSQRPAKKKNSPSGRCEMVVKIGMSLNEQREGTPLMSLVIFIQIMSSGSLQFAPDHSFVNSLSEPETF